MSAWIPKSKTMKMSLAAGSLGVIAYCAGLLLVLNETQKIEDFYHNSESEFSKEERFLAVKSLVDSNKAEIQAVRAFFIPKGDEIKFIEKIEETAKSSGLEFEIVSIDLRPDESVSFKENISVKLKVEGSWREVASFLDRAEKMPFGSVIQKINLDMADADSWSGSVDMVVFREK